jgi:uncharacterized protein (DUF2235 family)
MPWHIGQEPFSLHALSGLTSWWSVAGFAIGIIMAQGAVETAWRWGLRFTEPRADGVQLARQRNTAAPTARPGPRPDRRRLIICCDGTWNSPGQGRETNVVDLVRSIKPVADDGITQLVHYHLGVGTGNVIDRVFGGGAGVGLSNSVKSCYGFLADNYRAGDEILLFGFSRGAYVVRSVAGMIGCVGLLKKRDMHRFYEAWDYYALSRSKRGDGIPNAIAPDRHENVQIACLGVWDTVGALGIPGTRLCAQTYAFHETQLGEHVRHAFQALAIDERRGNFQPAIWVREHPADDDDRVLEQVWFPGVHTNVGGGYDEHGLSDASLLWMLSRIRQYRLLDFEDTAVVDAVWRYKAERYAEGKLQDSRTLFWKAIACPVPRPICITDASESVHVSALDRRPLAPAGDPYAADRRQAWLEALGTVCPRSDLEKDPAFVVPDDGHIVTRIFFPNRGYCDRLTRWLFGET